MSVAHKCGQVGNIPKYLYYMEVLQMKNIKIVAVESDIYNENFPNSDAWKVTLKYKGRQYTFPFFMGYGHNGKAPTLDDVIPCILSDAQAGEMSIDEFMMEFGYESPSLAKSILKACQKIRRNVNRMFTQAEQE